MYVYSPFFVRLAEMKLIPRFFVQLVPSKLETQDQEDDLKLPTPAFLKEEGPIPHFAIIKLASLDIIASFALTIGFSIIGSGMYQVIYSSVVVWCAIFTWFFMGRTLSRVQWMAIIGTSLGLGISSLDSIRGSPIQEDAFASIQTGQEGNASCGEMGHVYMFIPFFFRCSKKCDV